MVDRAKEWLSTVTAHLPESCAEWLPDTELWHQWHPNTLWQWARTRADQWNANDTWQWARARADEWQQSEVWQRALTRAGQGATDLWEWVRTREWRVPELPRWGPEGRLVPEWVFPSFWRRRVRETVLWVWFIFITFLAARENRQRQTVEGPKQENDARTDDPRQTVPSVTEEAEEEEEEEEEDDEEAGGWRGGLERPGGLTRYPGIENLLAQPPTATPLPPRHRPPLPLAAAQVGNKQILRKPDDAQPRTEEREGGGEKEEADGEKGHKDEVWKTLLAKYGTEECVREIDKAAEEDEEEEAPEYVGTAEEIVERYAAKFEEPEVEVSPEEEFSAKVGRRLEEYLQRLDEEDEDSSQAKEVDDQIKQVNEAEKVVEEAKDETGSEEARDIEDGGEQLEGIASNGNENRIFILIEDEESEDDRRNRNDTSEVSEFEHAAVALDSETKEPDEAEKAEKMEVPTTQQNGFANEEFKEEASMEPTLEASEKLDDLKATHAADAMLPEACQETVEAVVAQHEDIQAEVTEEQPSDAAAEEKVEEVKKEDAKEEVADKIVAMTEQVVTDREEESLSQAGEEMKAEEESEGHLDATQEEQQLEEQVVREEELTVEEAPVQPVITEAKQEEAHVVMEEPTPTVAEPSPTEPEEPSEDVVMKEQESTDVQAPSTLPSEVVEETTLEATVVEEEKEDAAKKNEKEASELKAMTEVSVEEDKEEAKKSETEYKAVEESEEAVETEASVGPTEEANEVIEEEKKEEEAETEVAEGRPKGEEAKQGVSVGEAVVAVEPPVAVEVIQVDEDSHFESVKAAEAKDEAMVEEEHMEAEDVPVVDAGGWAQDVWGSLGQAPEAAPLSAPAAVDMMEEDTEDAMEVDVVEEAAETMEEDLEVFVDEVDLQELPESPVPPPTVPAVPEEDDALAEVQDLLVRPPPRRKRQTHRLDEELEAPSTSEAAAAAGDSALAKYMKMPAALTADEEEELHRYLVESEDGKELTVDKFMAMPAALTEQEQKELEEAVREQERVRQAESAGLERFLDMPAGLTEQEIRELQDLEREKKEAAEQPWERGDVGFEEYLSMPHTLTEEEERMLQEGGDEEDEPQFASEEEYREYIKNRFLSQLEEDALRMAEEEYDYDEDYDDEYEYEDEEEEEEDEEEDEDEDEGDMEGEYVMVSDLSAAASSLPQAAAAPAATTTAAKMVDEGVNTEPDLLEEDTKSKKKLFPFPKKSDRETTPEDSSAAATNKKFFHFGGLGTKRKKEAPEPLDKKDFSDPNRRKFDGGGGVGGSLSAAFCTAGGHVTQEMLQRAKEQMRKGKTRKGTHLKRDGEAEVLSLGGSKKETATRSYTRLTLKQEARDEGKGDAEKTDVKAIRLRQEGKEEGGGGSKEFMDPKSELEHLFAKIIKSYKPPTDDSSEDEEEANTKENGIGEDAAEAKRTRDANMETQKEEEEEDEEENEEDATSVFSKSTAERDLPMSPVLEIIVEEDEDAEIADVFEREMVKGGEDEEDFWLRWSNEERACVSASRDCASPWQLAEDDEGGEGSRERTRLIEETEKDEEGSEEEKVIRNEKTTLSGDGKQENEGKSEEIKCFREEREESSLDSEENDKWKDAKGLEEREKDAGRNEEALCLEGKVKEEKEEVMEEEGSQTEGKVTCEENDKNRKKKEEEEEKEKISHRGGKVTCGEQVIHEEDDKKRKEKKEAEGNEKVMGGEQKLNEEKKTKEEKKENKEVVNRKDNNEVINKEERKKEEEERNLAPSKGTEEEPTQGECHEEKRSAMADVQTTDAAMELQMDEDEDDFWGSRNDEDDFVPRRRPDPVYDQEEDDQVKEDEKEEEEAQEMMEEEEEEEEEEEGHLLGSDGDDAITSSKGARGLRFKKRTTTTTTTTTARTENGVGKVEKKEKKEVVEETEKAKTKKIEESVEKKKIEVKEEADKKKKIEMKEDAEKKKRIEMKEDAEKKKRIEMKEDAEKKKKKEVEEEEKENGVAEEITEKKKKKKHRDTEDGERRKKKKKKRDSEKENKKAAYQKRDDILEKHVGPRVRSFDAAKMKSKFEKPKQVSQVSSECRQCGKQVFQMEKIVAEKAAWHKNCFRCKECNCILTLETYQSHEGVLYCKPHFKELFRPKVVVEDPDEARKERLLRRPKLIVLESKPESLPEDVVRSTNKPDYGLEDLSTADLKKKFKMFEQIATEEERTPEPIPVRRSQSLLNKAARFMQGDDEYGIENSELGEYEDYDEDEDEEEDEEEEEEEEGEEGDEEKPKKKGRPTSFSGMKDLKAGFARKNRQDELTKKRRQELAKFRQMLCAGKNISTREIFEGGNEDEQGKLQRKEQIKIEGRPDAKNLRERFEKGLSITEDDEEESPDRREVDRVFKEAETASKARNLFKEIDKTVAEGGEPVMRPHTSAQARRENRLSRDGKRIRNFTSQVFEDDSNEEEEEDEKSSLAERFKFFATYEERAKDDGDKRRKKLFRFTPPPDGEDQVDEDLVKTHLPKRCMAFNCAVCRLRVIFSMVTELFPVLTLTLDPPPLPPPLPVSSVRSPPTHLPCLSSSQQTRDTHTPFIVLDQYLPYVVFEVAQETATLALTTTGQALLPFFSSPSCCCLFSVSIFII